MNSLFTFPLYLVVVDGRLYTDDEPYWECLLEEGKTYDVAYCRSRMVFCCLMEILTLQLDRISKATIRTRLPEIVRPRFPGPSLSGGKDSRTKSKQLHIEQEGSVA